MEIDFLSYHILKLLSNSLKIDSSEISELKG